MSPEPKASPACSVAPAPAPWPAPWPAPSPGGGTRPVHALAATPLDPRWRAFARPGWLANWRVQRLAVAGGELESVEHGAGPPLILLPPLPGWKEAYVALVPLLARHFRVLTFDLRSRFDGAPNWEALVADLETIAEVRFGGPVAVLGHSLGGALALRWAATHPARIRALVVSSGFARVFTPPAARVARYVEQPAVLAAMRWLPGAWSARLVARLAARRAWVFDAHCDPHVTELVRFGVRHVPLGLVRQRIRLALQADLRPLLPSVTCPTLLVHGEHDTPFALAAAGELERGLRFCERENVSGAGHLHPLSRPEALARLVVPWLQQLA